MWTEFDSPVPALVQNNTETQMWRENTHVSLQTLFYRLEASVLASLLKHKEKQCGKDHVRAKHKTHRRYQIWWAIWTEIHKPVMRTNHLHVTSDCKTINEPKLNELMLLINVSCVSAAEHSLFVVGRLCSVKHSGFFILVSLRKGISGMFHFSNQNMLIADIFTHRIQETLILKKAWIRLRGSRTSFCHHLLT